MSPIAGAAKSEVGQFYCRSWSALVSYAFIWTGEFCLAEDAVQTAFVKLMDKDMLPRELRPYMFRAVRNEALQRRRSANREPPLPEGFDTWWSLAAPECSCAESKDLMDEAMKILREQERETIVLKELVGMTLREIAQIQEVSIKTVASWHRRGMFKLRQRLYELEGKQPPK